MVRQEGGGAASAMTYDAAGNLVNTRSDGASYGWNEVNYLDVRYKTISKNIEDAHMSGMRRVWGATGFLYDANGNTTFVDRGHKNGASEDAVVRLTSDAEGHILSRSDSEGGELGHVGAIRGFAQLVTGSTFKSERRGRQEVVNSLLGGGDHHEDLRQYVYANGQQVGEVHAQYEMSVKWLQAGSTSVTVQAEDIVSREDGSLDRTATATKIAQRVYGLGTLEHASARQAVIDAVAARLPADDAQVQAGAALTVDKELAVVDARQTQHDQRVNYAFAPLSGEDGLIGQGLSSHIVVAGETLRSIAQAQFGDSQYWYLIADANGLEGNEELKAGTTLIIPNQGTGAVNSKDSYKVYNEGDIIGATSPEIRTKKKKKSFFQKLVLVLVVVIAIVAACFIGPLAAMAFQAVAGAIGTATVLATVAGAVAGTVAAAAVGAVIAAEANALSQGLMIAADLQDKFDHKALRHSAGQGAVAGAFAGVMSGVEGANWYKDLGTIGKAGVQIAAEAGKQIVQDGKITSYSSLVLAGLQGASQGGGASNAANGAKQAGYWAKTSEALKSAGEVYKENSRSISAGLRLLENLGRGQDNTLSWASFAVEMVGAKVLGHEKVTAENFRTGSSESIDWAAFGQETLVAGAGAALVADRNGGDAGRNFFGQQIANPLAAALDVQNLSQRLGQTLFGPSESEQRASEDLRRRIGAGLAELMERGDSGGVTAREMLADPNQSAGFDVGTLERGQLNQLDYLKDTNRVSPEKYDEIRQKINSGQLVSFQTQKDLTTIDESGAVVAANALYSGNGQALLNQRLVDEAGQSRLGAALLHTAVMEESGEAIRDLAGLRVLGADGRELDTGALLGMRAVHSTIADLIDQDRDSLDFSLNINGKSTSYRTDALNLSLTSMALFNADRIQANYMDAKGGRYQVSQNTKELKARIESGLTSLGDISAGVAGFVGGVVSTAVNDTVEGVVGLAKLGATGAGALAYIRGNIELNKLKVIGWGVGTTLHILGADKYQYVKNAMDGFKDGFNSVDQLNNDTLGASYRSMVGLYTNVAAAVKDQGLGGYLKSIGGHVADTAVGSLENLAQLEAKATDDRLGTLDSLKASYNYGEALGAFAVHTTMFLAGVGALSKGAGMLAPRSGKLLVSGTKSLTETFGELGVKARAWREAAQARRAAAAEGKVVVPNRDVAGLGAPYNAREIGNSLEAKYPGQVTSTTLPSTLDKNVGLAGTRHPVSGIVFDSRGFPIFDDVAKFDTRIASKYSSVENSPAHMRAATRDLREAIANGQVNRSQFTAVQLRAIEGGKPNIPGLTWHHHQDVGRMQLIPTKIHQQTGHVGGYEMWFR